MEAKSQDHLKASASRKMLEQAINGLREIGMAHHLPPALLVYSELLCFLGKFSEARNCVEEAEQVATHGMMLPYVADCYIEYARQDLAQNAKQNAKENLVKAREMINGMGYHRRDRDLMGLLQQVST